MPGGRAGEHEPQHPGARRHSGVPWEHGASEVWGDGTVLVVPEWVRRGFMCRWLSCCVWWRDLRLVGAAW